MMIAMLITNNESVLEKRIKQEKQAQEMYIKTQQ